MDIHSKNLDFTAEAYKAVAQYTHREPTAVIDIQLQRYLEEHNGEREIIKMNRNREERKKRSMWSG